MGPISKSLKRLLDEASAISLSDESLLSELGDDLPDDIKMTDYVLSEEAQRLALLSVQKAQHLQKCLDIVEVANARGTPEDAAGVHDLLHELFADADLLDALVRDECTRALSMLDGGICFTYGRHFRIGYSPLLTETDISGEQHPATITIN